MNADRLLDTLGNEHARAVLATVSDGPCSVEEITNRIDASQPTVYRQVDSLCSLGLLTEGRGYEDGTHYQTYEATLESVEVHLGVNGFELGFLGVEDGTPDIHEQGGHDAPAN
jgi:predicted transcriptional regulator